MNASKWWGEDWRESFPDGVTLSLIVPVYNERFLDGVLIRRLLDLSIPQVATIEIIVVDDASSDGTGEILDDLVASHPEKLQLFRHQTNQGKGAALRTGIARASGDLIVFQDADLEYDPSDLAELVRPFWEDGADVVYGSRFATGGRRRVVYFRHSMGNRLITFLSNLFTDLNLTDVETCYKMFRAPLLKSIPIRSTDFAVEIELTAKIAKRNCSVFEVPISYRGRTYREGKKIGWRDGVKALYSILRYWLVDDLYREDEFGGTILHNLERAQRFNGWMADAIAPNVGKTVLEIGAGIGNITSCLTPRDLYVASDVNANYLHYLRNFAAGRPYLKVARVDLEDATSFSEFEQKFDTVICLNVLEHVQDPNRALANIHGALAPGGRLLLYVPQGQGLYSSLDVALGHRCRYDRKSLSQELVDAGFTVETLKGFNRISVLGWWWNGKIMRRSNFGRLQIKLFDLCVPLLKLMEPWLPGRGLGLIAVARKSS
jgi:glycosyltransferase involved in cell wall biosynthesis